MLRFENIHIQCGQIIEKFGKLWKYDKFGEVWSLDLYTPWLQSFIQDVNNIPQTQSVVAICGVSGKTYEQICAWVD